MAKKRKLASKFPLPPISYKVPEDIRKQPIEWLNLKPENMQVLRDIGAVTIEDVIPIINTLPIKTLVAVKQKLVFGMEDT